MRTTSTRLLVKRYTNSVHWDLDGLTISDAVSFLSDQEKYVKAQFPDVTIIRLSFDIGYGDYGLNLIGYAPENDKERKIRKEREASEKARCEEYQRKQYEILKKKFK